MNKSYIFGNRLIHLDDMGELKVKLGVLSNGSTPREYNLSYIAVMLTAFEAWEV